MMYSRTITKTPTCLIAGVLLLSLLAVSVDATECCKVCVKGQACGNTCISDKFDCQKASGCACNAPSCCKLCTEQSKPCGDTCIASDLTCTKPPGCACSVADTKERGKLEKFLKDVADGVLNLSQFKADREAAKQKHKIERETARTQAKGKGKRGAKKPAAGGKRASKRTTTAGKKTTSTGKGKASAVKTEL